jgi:hypothetical protein
VVTLTVFSLSFSSLMHSTTFLAVPIEIIVSSCMPRPLILIVMGSLSRVAAGGVLLQSINRAWSDTDFLGQGLYRDSASVKSSGNREQHVLSHRCPFHL